MDYNNLFNAFVGGALTMQAFYHAFVLRDRDWWLALVVAFAILNIVLAFVG